jgi:DNA topoisomerase-1
MVIKIGRYGEFMACSKYPECKNAKSLKAQLDIPCPLCQKMMVEKKSKRGKIFYGCSNYPKCQFALWDKPINEKCPACNYSLLTEKKTKDVQEKVCPNCKAKFMA